MSSLNMNNNSQNFAPPLILNDSPAEELFPDFQFEAYIDTIFDRLVNKENETPLTISIEGEWGSGKTTAMQHLKMRLDKAATRKQKKNRVCRTVWFQAWKYNNQDEILSALIHEIVDTIGKNNHLKGYFATVFKNKVLKNIITNIFNSISFLGVKPFSNFGQSEHTKNLAYYYHFSNFLKLLIQLITRRISKNDFTEAIKNIAKLSSQFNIEFKDDKNNDVLVIFIDDLDRCSDSKIVQVLESVRLFLDFPGTVVVMGISYSVIAQALTREKYNQPSAQYLEKIFQIRCELPTFHENQCKKYIQKIIDTNRLFESYNILESLSLAEAITIVASTPRLCKQLLNNISILFEIINRKKLIKNEVDSDSVDSVKFFKKVYRSAYKTLELSKDNLSNIQEYLKDIYFECTDDYYLMKIKLLCKNNSNLRGQLITFYDETNFVNEIFKEDMTFSHFLAFCLLKEAVIRCDDFKNTEPGFESLTSSCLKEVDFWKNLQYSYINHILIKNDKYKKIIFLLNNKYSNINLLIEQLPIDLCNLSLLIYHVMNTAPNLASTNLYDEMIKINNKFSISKFLVTNLRFVNFLKIIHKAKSNDLSKFIHFHCSKILPSANNEYLIQSGYENHPVTGVTWEGANKFAEEYDLKLPTVEQWCEAFGTEKYSYGNNFDASKCNTIESNLMDTTPVEQYPSGMSPKNVFDMTGNVWEWCLDKDEKTGYRVIKGGSWANRKEDATQVSQEIYPPNKGMATIGFRCVSLILR